MATAHLPRRPADLHQSLSSLRDNLQQPQEADLNGVAFALVRLQDTYNLTVDDLVEGDIRGRKAVQVLSGELLPVDCLPTSLSFLQSLVNSLNKRPRLRQSEILQPTYFH